MSFVVEIPSVFTKPTQIPVRLGNTILTGNETIQGSLSVNGSLDISNNLNVGGVSISGDVSASNISAINISATSITAPDVQPTLTAGTNITISGNTISAVAATPDLTDISNTNFSGVNITATDQTISNNLNVGGDVSISGDLVIGDVSASNISAINISATSITAPDVQPIITDGSLTIARTDGLQIALGSKQATITDGSLTIARTSGLQTALDSKQATITDGSLTIARTSGLQTALDGKQATIADGSLTIARTSGLQTALDSKQATITSSTDLTINSLTTSTALIDERVAGSMYISHKDKTEAYNYALRQTSGGGVSLNTVGNSSLELKVNNVAIATIDVNGFNVSVSNMSQLNVSNISATNIDLTGNLTNNNILLNFKIDITSDYLYSGSVFLICLDDGGDNECNGKFYYNRNSGHDGSGFVDIVVSSRSVSGDTPHGFCSYQTAQETTNSNTPHRFSLITGTFSGVSYVGLKYEGGDAFPFSEVYFDGLWKSTGTNTPFEFKLSSDVTSQTALPISYSEVSLQNKRLVIDADGDVTIAGNLTAPTVKHSDDFCRFYSSVNNDLTSAQTSYTAVFNTNPLSSTKITQNAAFNRFTINTAGYYKITANMMYENTTFTNRAVYRGQIFINGTDSMQYGDSFVYVRYNAYGEFGSAMVTTIVNLAVNDYAEIYVTLKKNTTGFGVEMSGTRVRLRSAVDFEYLGT